MYTIYDNSKNKIMEVQGTKNLIIIERFIGNFINIKYRLKAYDLFENEVFEINKKNGKLFKEFEVKLGEEKMNISQDKKLLSKPSLQVKFKNNIYSIDGNIMAREFNVFNKDFKVCSSIYKKRFKLNDFYEIHIVDEEFDNLGIIICLLVDCCFSI